MTYDWSQETQFRIGITAADFNKYALPKMAGWPIEILVDPDKRNEEVYVFFHCESKEGAIRWLKYLNHRVSIPEDIMRIYTTKNGVIGKPDTSGDYVVRMAQQGHESQEDF